LPSVFLKHFSVCPAFCIREPPSVSPLVCFNTQDSGSALHAPETPSPGVSNLIGSGATLTRSRLAEGSKF